MTMFATWRVQGRNKFEMNKQGRAAGTHRNPNQPNGIERDDCRPNNLHGVFYLHSCFTVVGADRPCRAGDGGRRSASARCMALFSTLSK